ncbi:hypothetical protein TanjilG_12829 [Lupinus angustifolius]|uniref:DUF599 domain-containing protein n=1 Tax=Lupinus angustifolius TaxID=3871 RepID=A0A1J7HPZ5_LUPAN|nr:PREDICTED: uncharacterized protein LOC109360585 [Lupinus angustifolius]OIW02515.1 hypothetical protein TanjilG_12829 [Lupinus angustifolius]
MEKKVLDLILVPTGLLLMFAYHFWLLVRVVKHPTKTVIGVNAIHRRSWVEAMMEDVPKNGVLAVQSIRNNIMASTLLASTAIMLGSLITVLMGTDNKEKTVTSESFGDRSQIGLSIKFFSILVCFMFAFLLNVQSVRYYSHASILINVPFKKLSQNLSHQMLTVEYVAATINRGSYFWSLGLRAFYFSVPLFMWIFGPIPMLFSCFTLLFMLYFLDVTFECGWVGADENVVKAEVDKHHIDMEIGKAN